MAQSNPTRSRLLRAGILSASVLSFIPVFTLVRRTNADASTPTAAPQTVTSASGSRQGDGAPSRSVTNGSQSTEVRPYATPSGQLSRAGSSPTPSAQMPLTRPAPHSRTRAS